MIDLLPPIAPLKRKNNPFKFALITGCALFSLTTLSACQNPGGQNTTKQAIIETQSKALNDWFEARFEDELARSPMTQTYLGRQNAKDKLDDVSQLAMDENAALAQAWLEDLHAGFDIDRVDPATRLSYRLYEYSTQDTLATHEFSDHEYVFQHMSGPHTDLPSFLINFHSVNTVEDAQAYIARLKAVPDFLAQHSERAQTQYETGIRLPRFVYEKITQASKNVITGDPFTPSPDNAPDNAKSKDSPLFADIKKKINALDITGDEKSTLIDQARSALINHVQPSYEKLINMFAIQGAGATDDDGAWKLPRGAAYYQSRLKHYTTTNLTADEIHALGIKEVTRIQSEMQKIMDQVGFEGSLQDFYNFLRTDPQFVFPNTDAGRAQYISEATDIIDEMKAMMDDLFITKPKADMIVKRVEPFREDTAFGAFYNQPALDGSRPGTYYINLRDVSEQPTYLMQALAYHEGIPGHHMQIAIAQELDGLPKFRTLGGYTSYIEGWALYSESLPKELGLYTDPYKDFGRLSMEIFRAARLVVDTGIHAKKWTREQAVQYYLDNIPNPEGDVRAEIDRYIVWPGQATAYKIGMLKIQALRKKAEDALGAEFKIREFHDVVLANGAVPLTILEELVDEWIARKSS